MTMPASSLSETLRARRPPAEVGVTSTVPASFSSRTMLDTVAADRPVVLAISACVREPARRTARTTRSRLARCSDDCDPGVSTTTSCARGRFDEAPSTQLVNSKLSCSCRLTSRGCTVYGGRNTHTYAAGVRPRRAVSPGPDPCVRRVERRWASAEGALRHRTGDPPLEDAVHDQYGHHRDHDRREQRAVVDVVDLRGRVGGHALGE